MRLTRRTFLAGGAAVALSATAGRAQQRRLFDSLCHIIDHRFPIVPNQGDTPPHFPLEDYLAQAKPLGWGVGAGLVGAAIVGTAIAASNDGYYYDGYRRCGWVRQFDAFGNYIGRVRTCSY